MDNDTLPTSIPELTKWSIGNSGLEGSYYRHIIIKNDIEYDMNERNYIENNLINWITELIKCCPDTVRVSGNDTVSIKVMGVWICNCHYKFFNSKSDIDIRNVIEVQ